MIDARAATRRLRPEIASLWIRRAFREWSGPDRPWVDLAEGRMGRAAETAGATPKSAVLRTAALPAPGEIDRDGGLLYVPPVDAGGAAERGALVDALVARGIPVLVQLAPGELLDSTAWPDTVAVDLLETLLARDLERLESVPSGSIAVWPLIAALTEDDTLWEDGCRRLRAAGVACVHALALELDPADRRRLAGDQHAGEIYSRLVHGRATGERRFAAVAARHGLGVFYRRRDAGADRKRRNDALAELLALAGELALRLDRGEVLGQQLFRASRWVEDSATDVRALAIEGNLEIVESLRAAAVAEIVGQWARTGASATVDQWIAEYVAGAPA
jgi:hypothetical protein